MYENDYMYAIERNPDYLAHYGIRGMKWGVRRAIQSGNSAKLGRQYAKAQKKLAKLEKRAANSGKYAKRAALLGAGAAAAGGLAAAGTGGVARGISGIGKAAMGASRGIGKGLVGAAKLGSKIPGGNKAAGKVMTLGYNMQGLGTNGSRMHKGIASAANSVAKWGREKTIGEGIQREAGRYAGRIFKGKNAAFNTVSRDAARNATSGIAKLNNNTIARIGAGAIGAGLAVGAARNAYKAATAKRKAEKFRSAMNESFKGTKYANGGNRQGKKRRR